MAALPLLSRVVPLQPVVLQAHCWLRLCLEASVLYGDDLQVQPHSLLQVRHRPQLPKVLLLLLRDPLPCLRRHSCRCLSVVALWRLVARALLGCLLLVQVVLLVRAFLPHLLRVLRLWSRATAQLLLPSGPHRRAFTCRRLTTLRGYPLLCNLALLLLLVRLSL